MDGAPEDIASADAASAPHTDGLPVPRRYWAMATIWAAMAMTVLEEWGVRQCPDIGELVFNMVEAGLLAKTEKDSREDFRAGYDFTDAFRKPFWPKSKQSPPPQSVAR